MNRAKSKQGALAGPRGAIAWAMGLGNPGAAYEGTRHNAGSAALRALARESVLLWRMDASRRGELCHWDKVGLLIPATWMNESGKVAAALSSKDGERGASLLVIHEDVELDPGSLRLKFGGGLAGHNGLRSIAAALGKQDFGRLRIGVGHHRRRGLEKAWRIGRFQNRRPTTRPVWSWPTRKSAKRLLISPRENGGRPAKRWAKAKTGYEANFGMQ